MTLDRLRDLCGMLAVWVRALSPWRRRFAAMAAGAVSVLAFAPFFLWPVLWATFPIVAWLAEGAEECGATASWSAPWNGWAAGRAAETGWWWGFGFFAFGLSWIGEAFLVEAEVFAWLLPFAVTLLPAGLALFMAAAMAFATRLARPGMLRVLAMAAAFGITEWLRGHILTGFPWNVLGYALTYPLPLMQWASVFGIYGLTVLTVIAFMAPAVLLARSVQVGEAAEKRRLRRAAVGAFALPLVMLGVGAVWRGMALGPYDAARAASPQPVVRIVQPSVLQRDKWRAEHQRRIFEEHLALSVRDAQGRVDGAAGVALIVWPEAAMPFRPLDTPAALAEIGRMLASDTVLISGALVVEEAAPGSGSGRRVFNSLLAFGEGGRLVGRYDKTHLVPFGEYLPLQKLLEGLGLRQLTQLRGGFAAGANPRPFLTLPSTGSFGPLICYEAIFPDLRFAPGERPRALINVTNDGWFGNSIGPRQHLHQATVRAVEHGLPLLRAANNGISAVIDPYGRIWSRLELNARGALDSVLPTAIGISIYSRWGDWILTFMIGLPMACILLLKLRMRALNQ